MLDNISGVLDARARIAPIAAALALYLAGWAFLSGGILDRYARQRPIHVARVLCGVRRVLLPLPAARGRLPASSTGGSSPTCIRGSSTTQFDNLTRGMSVERTAFLVRALFYVIFGAAPARNQSRRRLHEGADRRGGSAQRARRARGRAAIHPHITLGRCSALYALNSLTFLALIAVWALVAPGVGGAGSSMWAGFVVAQLYIVARLLHEAAVHRLADRALPGEPRARVVHVGAGAGMAGLAGGGGHPSSVTSGIGYSRGHRIASAFGGRVDREGNGMAIRISSWLSRPLSLRSLLVQARLAIRLFREPRVPMLLKAFPLLAVLYVVSPIDLVPDFIPGLGQLDDLGIILAALELFVRLCPGRCTDVSS